MTVDTTSPRSRAASAIGDALDLRSAPDAIDRSGRIAAVERPQPRATIKPKLRVVLCAPRGFCAGVVRAIDTVEEALRRHGAPIYVRHEIVHNKYVVATLEAKGVVFVEELDEIADPSRPVIFSAHGVPKAVVEEAEARQLFAIDAACPLVTKVHREAERHFAQGRQIVLIGNVGKPDQEVVGVLGQLPSGAILLVQTLADVENLRPRDEARLAYATSTTLSVDDTRAIVEALTRRFPAIVGPPREDICYATTNRQEAVKRIAPTVDAMLVIGSSNSSNSRRLRETAERAGCKLARLVMHADDVEWGMLSSIASLGITAGASAPEILVDDIIDAVAERFELQIETVSTADESVFFPLPRELRPTA
ncbi:4-hydroxy-3-methylbut-2-enyl diphosphate reductase [Methylosinus sp. KRF6]|uniref:4-hydroxy-3-methylbut-2-enyl diphosphate reductase n=1 Tax=Methylosinus sp. KRF6 TaxID=2846853 RepID=UPI001C0E2239|nr:4-hydroxy-3-methylbut-2-enyl diphosphate reductase [Methylosinus sp. KRF6]MBU3888731.1 4-hydroxy-3-methylbut-2-enyl diphosphate reductase [Methylosinus sp. KRF6]